MDALNELAVFSRREPGERLLATLAGAVDKHPALVVAFEVPTPLQLAQYEARAMNAIRAIKQGALSLMHYDLPDGQLTDDEIEGLSLFITAVESAQLLWKDWNFALQPDEGPAVKAPLDLAHILIVLGKPAHRQAWNIWLDVASPLERAEGNGSGVSPNTSSDVTEEAPTTAGDASSETPPAPEAAPDPADNSAPEADSSPEPPKED